MNATKKILMYSIMLVMLMWYGVSYAQTTVTVDGVAVDFATLVVNITTVAEPPEPPIDPPEPPIDPIPPPANCGTQPPNGDIVDWEDRYMFQVDWPGPKSRQAVRAVPRNGYVCAEFTTTNVDAKGAVSNFEASSSEGGRWISLSKCRGEFNDVPDICQKWVGASSRAIPWATYPRNGYCQLEKNTTYCFNVKFDNPCLGTYCNTTLRATNRDY